MNIPRAARRRAFRDRPAGGVAPLAAAVAVLIAAAGTAPAETAARRISAAGLPTTPTPTPVADPAPGEPPAPAATPPGGDGPHTRSTPLLAVIPGVPAPPNKGRRSSAEAIIPPLAGPPPSRGPLPLETELLPMTLSPTAGGGAATPAAGSSRP